MTRNKYSIQVLRTEVELDVNEMLTLHCDEVNMRKHVRITYLALLFLVN